ncbi:MAG: aminotransferase class IV [Planctomycetes bacterium]|nr:aminotransferase class IV [Planctomycetota bacterium]
MTATVYFNGQFMSANDARASVFDGGWLHGAGLFETMRAQNGRVFRLEAHIERLRNSAKTILQPLERESLPSAAICEELLTRNMLDAARVRLTVTAGSMLEGGEGGLSPTVCLTAAPLSEYPAELDETGVQVAVCEYKVSPNDPIAPHKTTSYLPRLLGLREARRARCVEALWFTTRHTLAEGCISNVFVVRGGTLATPPLDTPVLPGITRGIVLDLARKEGIESEETDLGIHDVLNADEVFITNSIMQVLPVVRVEKSEISGSRVGEMTGRISKAYRALVKSECDKQ